MYRLLPFFTLIAAGYPASAAAHSFGVVYSLPIPFWLYAWGAGAALLVSFLAVALLARQQRYTPPAIPGRSLRLPAVMLRIAQVLGVITLALTVASGLFGVPNPYANFSMTAFWIVFLLGLAYAQALFGDLYRLLNPWRALCEWLQPRTKRYRNSQRVPLRGYGFAIALYLGLIWVELLGGVGPQGLAALLLAYTALCLAGACVFGIDAWFERGEMFSVLFGLLSRCSPLWIQVDDRHRIHLSLRRPGASLETGTAAPGLLIFILVVLAATAFDGLHETEVWYRLYWVWFYPEFLVDWVGSNPLAAYPKLNRLYLWWQTGWLLLFPLLYWLALIFSVWCMARIGGRHDKLMHLASRFGYSLVPIALVYHVAHYFALVWTQGVKIVPLLSDPFGRSQDWFGTAKLFERVNIPDLTWVWHIQVGLIVLGHVASVVLAHRTALRLFGAGPHLVPSQLPMLLLMIGYTVAGLWILSQPFQGGR